jgi:tetratricopeptide (TPR) repeat protein
MFGDAGSARPLLESTGLPSRSQPAWNGLTAETFWWEDSRLLADGKVSNGRRRLLTAAREQYPANPIFAAVDEERAEPGVWKVPPRLAWFVGREEQLAELAEELAAGSVVSVVALAGMGGVGKTALAVEYAWQHEADFDVVWWIEAEQAEFVPSHLAELGEALGLPAEAEPAAVFAELRRRGKPWLVVFDNAEDLAAVAPFRPADRRGRVLVTSRRTGWGGLGATVEVPTLSRTESVALLTSRRPDVDPDVADRIARLLGDLALALEQAAAFCEQNNMPMSDLAELLAERLDDVLDQGVVADRAGATVATLWDLSTRRLAVTSPAAVELLELFALCAPTPLPLDLLDSRAGLLGRGPLAFAATDRLTRAQTVGALVGYSLASRDDSTMWVHRLVQAATRRRMDESRRAKLLEVLLRLLRIYLPDEITRSPDNWPRWREMLPHVRVVLARADDLARAPSFVGWNPSDLTTIASWLCDRSATYLVEHGKPDEALPLSQRALAIDEEVYGQDHPDVARDLNTQAEALRDLGREDEALPLVRRALAIAEKFYGLNHPEVVVHLSGQALALWRLWRVDEALPLFQRALAIDEDHYGPEHPNVAVHLGNQALMLRALGRADEALPLFQRALGIIETRNGPQHPNLAAVLSGQAVALRELGRGDEALPLFQRALTITERLYGPDHPNVGRVLSNHAAALRDLGRLDEALPLFQRALTIDERLYGPDHPDVTAALTDYASVLLDLGRADEALPLFQQALTTAEKLYGSDHPYCQSIRHDLAAFDRYDRVGDGSDRPVSGDA